MIYRMAPFPMTLSDLQGQAGNTSLFRCFLNSRAADDKVLTGTARRAVPLRQRSFITSA